MSYRKSFGPRENQSARDSSLRFSSNMGSRLLIKVPSLKRNMSGVTTCSRRPRRSREYSYKPKG